MMDLVDVFVGPKLLLSIVGDRLIIQGTHGVCKYKFVTDYSDVVLGYKDGILIHKVRVFHDEEDNHVTCVEVFYEKGFNACKKTFIKCGSVLEYI